MLEIRQNREPKVRFGFHLTPEEDDKFRRGRSRFAVGWNQTDPLFMHLVNKHEFGHSVDSFQLTPLGSLSLGIR